MAATARQGTIDKANAALGNVVVATAVLAAATLAVATAEADLRAKQERSGQTLRALRGEIELRVSDVAPYGPPASSPALQKAYLVELEDGERYDYDAAVRIRDYLQSVHTSRLP